MAKQAGIALKIPPPLVFLAAIVATYGLKRLVPALRVDIGILMNIGLALAMLGMLLALLAVAEFLRQKTTVNPHRPDKTTALVTGGVFALSRNPMYLALALISAGTVLMQAAPIGLVFVAGAIWFITRYQIIPEESALSQTFGEDFAAYRTRVRRWI